MEEATTPARAHYRLSDTGGTRAHHDELASVLDVAELDGNEEG